LLRDPDISVRLDHGYGGGSTPNTGRFFIALRPFDERTSNASQVTIAAAATRETEGVNVFCRRAGHSGRRQVSRGQYQYTLQDSDIQELSSWSSSSGKDEDVAQLADVPRMSS